ncbi:MAG: hypothetical protein A3E85_00875 [Gammaproteobacteria bacterium RIFCSPHIGHO2_12_FULL_45_12]|nr:MAG: hypothetical protein A3E85_00875 [Gammaproteobacteria bacterium RIFCSPHIGHO2_12_FULL_45_12]
MFARYRSTLENLGVLLAGMVGGGFLSVHFGKELSWDLANYHFYNPFSFWHQRWQTDVWLNSYLHVHFTPTLDFLTYFLINTTTPKATTFLMGALHGINFWLLYCIARQCLAKMVNSDWVRLPALLLALSGMYGPTALTGMGTFQQDEIVSLFVLVFVALQGRVLSGHSRGWMIFSGWLLGVGVGCKLTAGVFVGGALLAYLVLDVSLRVKCEWAALFLVSVIIGWLSASGYWMWFLWQQYQNPFYPLWNGIFHSSAFPFYNWKDSRFLPHGLLEAIFYPFFFSWNGRVSDNLFRDFRFPALYAALLGVALNWLIKKVRRIPMLKPDRYFIWLFAFFIFSYVWWEYLFSIMRYIVSLEMLTPLLIYLLICQLVRDAWLRAALATLVFVIIARTMLVAGVPRVPWYKGDYFNVQWPASLDQVTPSAVLMPYSAFALSTLPRPQTYLIPFLPSSWRVVGVPFADKKRMQTQTLEAVLKHLHPQKWYLLATDAYLPSLYQLSDRVGLKQHKACGQVMSDRLRMTNERLWLCQVAYAR